MIPRGFKLVFNCFFNASSNYTSTFYCLLKKLYIDWLPLILTRLNKNIEAVILNLINWL